MSRISVGSAVRDSESCDQSHTNWLHTAPHTLTPARGETPPSPTAHLTELSSSVSTVSGYRRVTEQLLHGVPVRVFNSLLLGKLC